jgi:hypothetical protein
LEVVLLMVLLLLLLLLVVVLAIVDEKLSKYLLEVFRIIMNEIFRERPMVNTSMDSFVTLNEIESKRKKQ